MNMLVLEVAVGYRNSLQLFQLVLVLTGAANKLWMVVAVDLQ
jgi:hypothetical protein